ncbi:DUF397 domain-containing protein [Streptomyces sp. ID05-26A]|nr:DUF397 domain-containing protein [Streptomyces sp. ID05-26A]
MNGPSVQPDIAFTPWFKSSYSQPKESNCVEVRFGADQAGVRDSKAPSGGQLAFGTIAWGQFRSWVNGPQSEAAEL